MDFPAPKNVKQLRGFLGLVNFYSKFSSRHAAETVPLLNLIKKGVPWKWDENMQRSFNRVKQLFCETITLYFPDPRKSHYLETDASNYALGAILYQKNQDRKGAHIINRTDHMALTFLRTSLQIWSADNIQKKSGRRKRI